MKRLLFLLCLPTAAMAQDYRFPAGDEHYGYFYPTAYKDNGGADWNCGGIYYSGHNGSDFGVGGWGGMDEGRRIVAAADGVVVGTNDGEYDRCSTGDCGDANYVMIEHANGRRTWYWHLKQWTVAVSPGQAVTCGTHLGYAGSSGNSTGPHIHFEVREASGSASDPFDGPCSGPPTYWISQGAYNGLPGGSCPYTGPCSQVATLGCGQTISSANNAGGASQSHSVYGCGQYPSSGPEIAYAFTTPIDEPVSIGLTGLGADLDMFLLNSTACDGSGAIGCSTNSNASDEWISFNATAGAVYTIVVDGWEGATSGFNLVAQCTGGPPPDTEPPQESVPPTESVVPTTDDSAPVAEWSGLPGDRVPLGGLGCGSKDEGGGVPQEGDGLPGTPTPLSELGCRSGAGAALLVVVASRLRRRRRES
ncbi:MAG TPA: peptidoglycan DD-metalloendopeptidase family protein [Myxococcota bacterium]|nr:peptidoglycan DD-metalloendopeptidase family protein [Myxococcota bacterium]